MKHARTPHAAVPNYTAQQPSLVPRTPPRTLRAAQSLHSVAFSSGFSSLHAAYLLCRRRRRARRRVEENIRIVDHHFSASSHIRYAAATIDAPPPPSSAKAAAAAPDVRCRRRR